MATLFDKKIDWSQKIIGLPSHDHEVIVKKLNKLIKMLKGIKSRGKKVN